MYLPIRVFDMCRLYEHTASVGLLVRAPEPKPDLEEPFVNAFAKLRKVSISFVMPVCLSFLMEQFGSHWVDFHEI
jgi:hypothetical protein